MTKHSHQIAVNDEYIPFADLYLSEMNPRSIIADDSITALAENIRHCGLIQNPAGLRDARGKVGIVAGGRRFRALALLQDEPRFQTVCVRMAPDLATAELWASSENAQREALHPADEIRDYGTMQMRGVKPADIAMAYGVTEKHVYRRLALASLPAPVLDALKAGTVSLSQAAAFTISNDEALTLEVLARHLADVERGAGGMNEHRIKSHLKPESIKASDRRAIFVGLDDYKAAGGRIGGDLFAEEVFFDDPQVLEAVFVAKLEAARADFAAAQGWSWVEALTEHYIGWNFCEERKFARLYKIEGELSEAEADRYAQLLDQADEAELSEAESAELEDLQRQNEGDYSQDQRSVSGAAIYVDFNGKLKSEVGFVRREDSAAAVALGLLEPSRHADPIAEPKSALSEKLKMDLGRIETGARQTAMLADPTLALHLLAFQLCGEMGFDRAFGLRMDDVRNAPESATGFALDPRLATLDEDIGDPFNRDHAAEFAKFRKQGDEKIMALLNCALARQLSVSDDGLAAMIDTATKKRTRETFTPNAENFFSRVGGPYLLALWAELLGLKTDHPTVTTFEKLKKAEKATKLEALFASPAAQEALGLTKAQIEKINAWLPEGMK